MIVELERDPTLYPDGNIIEVRRDTPIPRVRGSMNLQWPRAQGSQPALDGFTIRRAGDQPTRIRVLIHLEQNPEQYKVSPELGALLQVGLCCSVCTETACYIAGYVLGIKEDSRIGVIQALWNYIKINGLQDKVDRRKIKADDYLRPVRIYLAFE